MTVHEDFLSWAKNKGVKYTGIRPRSRETIISVPVKALHTLETVKEEIAEKLITDDVSVQGILAADMMVGSAANLATWIAVLPARVDLEVGMPILWPQELQELLPKTAKTILRKQQTKFRRDADKVLAAFSHFNNCIMAGEHNYLSKWLLIGTRTFYYITPSRENLSFDDCLALTPLADLFNHANSGCQVSFSSKSYKVTANRAYHTSEEIYVCYGNHSNDFLIEYGFVLAENRWDEICLDEVIIPALSEQQKAELKTTGYLGNYMLDAETAGCFRTQVALRLMVSSRDEWQSFLNSGDGIASQAKVDILLAQLIDIFLRRIQEKLQRINNLHHIGQERQRRLLARRWEQIKTLFKKSAKSLRCYST
ncbi:uncharacterized protein MKZ38_001504 [Zalerion maritima]|uniref:SET domain-containing protein n=1 Tax=Zalerion maritima TaxID=339359 RepID=A0AAD5RR55_9PEZI|nr:uncharacterized protein MKZ38_001504 [Zalerion maritima]